MSAHTADHEATLRAALHAAADSLEPRSDGLERIRARIHQPRPATAWLQAAYGEIAMRTPTFVQDAAYRVADWYRVAADWLRLAYERFAPAQAPGRHRSRTQGLLRPLAAMAVVMFIVAAGTYVAIDASTAIFPSSSSNAPAGGPNAGGHSGGPAHGASHAGGTQSALGTGSHSPVPNKSCTPKPGVTTSATPPQPSASPSLAPSPTDSVSADPSASPADTSTTSPAASVAPSAAPANPPTTSPGLVAKSPAC